MNAPRETTRPYVRTLSLLWLILKVWIIVLAANTAQAVFLYENF